jgi:cation diffusion facilitator CzcD-associated flavoprotein CzcO
MNTDFQIGIIGSGLAGISTALKLKKAEKNSFVIFERAAEAGGIWRDNIYPECRCDVVSHVYSFLDEPNPNWESLYATQNEIFNYINHVIDKNQIRNHIRFNTDIIDATFVTAAGYWQLTDNSNNTIRVKVLVLALGKLNRPKIPSFKGDQLYRGRIIHTSQWDPSYDFYDKRIGVIGTGASAVQIIPAIAQTVKRLTVFQRNAAWITFRNNVYYSDAEQRKFRKFPLLLKIKRSLYFWRNELLGLAFIGPKWVNTLFRSFFLKNLAKAIDDPETMKKLIPSYTVGCKRVMRSDDYYPAFNRANVDLEVDPIDNFTADGIKTSSGKEYQLDAVIMATGFEVGEMNFKINIIGLKGRNLRDVWQANDGECYKGMITAGFPNLAFVSGPNSASGFNSSLLIMEYQAGYIMKYIREIEAAGKNSYLDLREDVQKSYKGYLNKKFIGSVWLSGCTSWQQNSRGKNVVVYPGFMKQFKRNVKNFKKEEYNLFRN